MKNRIKTGGRNAGTPNKVTSEVREQFKQLLENNIAQMQNDIDELKPKDRIKVLLELSRFIVPTLKSTEWNLETGRGIKPIVITGMVIK